VTFGQLAAVTASPVVARAHVLHLPRRLAVDLGEQHASTQLRDDVDAAGQLSLSEMANCL